jgi:hypothetical protein
MTSHTGRIYAIAIALVVFFLAWAIVAARPWQTTAADPRLSALAVRQSQLQRDAKLIRQLAAARLAAGHAAPAAAGSQPAVRIVNLPPLTITRTS